MIEVGFAGLSLQEPFVELDRFRFILLRLLTDVGQRLSRLDGNRGTGTEEADARFAILYRHIVYYGGVAVNHTQTVDIAFVDSLNERRIPQFLADLRALQGVEQHSAGLQRVCVPILF